MKNIVLIIDDDKKIAQLIATRLEKLGYASTMVHDGKSALDWIRENETPLVMLDVRLPDINGIEVLRQLLKIRPTSVIMISAHADVQVAVECIKIGAFDFLEKPFELPAFDAKVNQVFKQLRLEEEVAALRKELGQSYKNKTMVGASAAMKKVFQSIDMAAKSNVTVLIEGESGTGKELVARAIHENSASKSGPFVAVNCGAIPENLIESELFGHEKGAFTGAIARKIGKFEQAQGGTVFLDEIGELPPSLQVKLLRVLQEKEVERVGGMSPVPVQVKVLAATNQDLKKMIQEGKFREDLYYRVNVFYIYIPPLRERKEEIPELFAHFISRHGKDGVKTDEGAIRLLTEHHWPGNVRELENFVERLLLSAPDKKIIQEKDIQDTLHSMNGKKQAGPAAVAAMESTSSHDRVKAIHETEKAILLKALEDAGGNVSQASKMVDVSRDTFYRKMKKYSITKPS